MIDHIAKFIINRRLIILILFLLATIFFAYRSINVPVKTIFEDLVPRHPYSTLAEEFAHFGGANRIIITVAVKKGDIFTTPTLQKIIDISDAIKFVPGIDRNKVYSIGVSKIKNFKVTDWGMDFPMLMYPDPPTTPLGIGNLKKNIFRNTLYYGRMVSLDTRAALISAEFLPESLNFDLIYEAMEQFKKDNEDVNTEVYIEGDSYLYGVIDHYITQTMWIFAVTILMMSFLSFWFARMARLVFVPLASMLLCAVWGIGCAELMGFNIDPMVLVIPLLISARALSHSIQFGWRVNEEFIKWGDSRTACEKTIVALLYPGLAGVVTDGVGILLIALIPVPIMMKIGLIFFVWAMSVVPVVLIFNPIIYSYLPALKKADEWSKSQSTRALQTQLNNLVFNLGKGKRAWGVLGITVVIAIIVGYITVDRLEIGDIQPGTPFLKEHSRYNRDVKIINTFFPGLVDPFMIICDGKKSEGILFPEVMEDMSNMQFRLMQMPEVMGTLSIVDLIQNLNMKLHEDDPRFYFVPDTSAGVFARLFMLTGGGAEPGDFDQYYDDLYAGSNVVAYLKDHTAKTLDSVQEQCRSIIAEMKRPEQVHEFRLAMARAGSVAAVNESVEKNEQLITILVFLSTFIFCAISFQSFMAGFILILPLGFANLFCFAYMAVSNIGLNLQTLPVSAIAVGVGVDYGVYLIERIRDEYSQVGDMEKAINNTLITTGHALTVTGLIMVMGVIFWNWSTIKFQADMGLFLSIVTLLHIIGTLFIIPALVRVINPSFILKSYKGKEVTT